MPNTYLFYDIETSGLNKCFDQVLQFAAIRTDLELNELERHEFCVKLNPDIIPSPAAILVHQVTMEQMQSGRCEYEAISEIHRLFNVPGTVSVGYNSLGFDDEFLRFSFYRNLLAPYTHQFANDCGRMDIYPMAVMYYLFKPEGINWPKIDGVVTLKLEHLGAANNIIMGSAHNAIHDVETTLDFARLLRRDQEMWEYLRGYFNKSIDLRRLENLTWINDQYQSALLIDGGIGSAKFYQLPVISLEFHHHYKNQSLWLPLDAFPLTAVTINNIATTTFIKRKRFGEAPLLLPLTDRFSRYLSKERIELAGANLDWLQKNTALFLEIVAYHQGYKYPEIPALDIDAALYQMGFVSDEERLQCGNFHAAPLRQKVTMVDDFSNINLRAQALRVLGRNYPELFLGKDDLARDFAHYLRRIKSGECIVNYKNEIRLSPQAALAEIDNLCSTLRLSVVQRELLDQLSRYIRSW